MKKPIPFGKYLLLERVNVGGMAEVFKAKAFGVEGFERLVAVKRILPSIAEDQEFITMFIDEAKISVQLTHANIAQIFDLGKVGDSYFIAMEYVYGKDLRAIFDRARKRGETVPVPMACYLAMKLCEGLDYAHNKKDASGRELNLVHRDVSPQNILLSYDGESKLIDFGIAKAAGKAGKTQAGILKGKFGYMSPEQVRGLPLDRRSDIFAVGICLYELLTGERLFVGESDFSTLEKVKNVEIMPPSTYNRRIPEELEQIVLKGLAKDVDDRYQTAMDLHDDLQSFMYTSGNFFSRKDLGAYMRKAFADEIAKESAREEEYRKMEAEAAKLGAGLEQFDDIEGDAPAAAANVSAQPARPAAPAPRGKGKSTMLGMPAVPAAVPPPPPRASMAGGPPPPPPRMSVPTPPPPPAPAAPAPAAKASSNGAALDMDWDEEELSTQIYDKPEGNLIAEIPQAAPSPRPSLGLGNLQTVAPAAPPPSMSTPGMPSPFSPSQSTPGMPSPFRPSGPSSPGLPATISQPMPQGSPSPFDATSSSAGREPTAVTRPRQESRGSMGPMIAAAAVLLLVLLAGGGYLLFGRSSPATVHLTTTPTDAVVYLDNQPITTSTSSPFVIPAVPPGSHLVEVRKHGFVTWAMRVDLTSGQELTLPSVTLAPEAGTPVATGTTGIPQPVQGTGFTLDTVPSGARVFVNGVELGQRTPVSVTDLQPGTYQIRVDNGATYAAWASQITIPAGQVMTLPAAVLTLRAVTVAFTSEPAGATVTLVRGGERRSIGSTPISADVDVSGGAWTVEMEHNGYRDYSAPLVVAVGEPSASHAAALEAAPRGGGGATRPPPPPPPTTSTGRIGSRIGTGIATGVAPPPPETRVAPPSGGGGNGTLRVQTRPASQVFVDGRLIGYTPQLHIELSAGRHSITLVNSDFNIRETRTVEIEAGQTTTQSLTLTPGGG